ncbi:MAG: class B sortase [Oscillospiraceae bacterium]|jgi:sortase B|nr:class B sortase [Oscillospiraceae bacterium]
MRLNQRLKKLVLLAIAAVTLLTVAASCKKSGETPADTDSLPQIDSSADTVSDDPRAPGSISYDDMMKKLGDASKINSYAKAWLTIPGTNIDYPVINDNDHKENNNYWLNRLLDGTESPNVYPNYDETVVYTHEEAILDADINKMSRNITLFGHNWDNINEPLRMNDPKDIMFAQLPMYAADIDFAQENPYVYFSTSDNEMVWKIFCVMYCETDWTQTVGIKYYLPNPNDSQMSILISEFRQRSMYEYNVDVKPSDKILTLSTCTRVYPGMGDSQRYVVVARLLRPDESDKDPVKVFQAINYKEPVV